MKLIIVSMALMLFSNTILAKSYIKQKSLKYKDSLAVFPNVLTAHYKITYDIKEKTVSAVSILTFIQDEAGYPVFDLVPNPQKVSINDQEAKFNSVNIPKVTKVRVLTKKLKKGQHILKIKNNITKLVKFKSNSVSNAFWMSDLSDREFLEQFLPVPLEYDQFKMVMDVKILGTSKPHKLFTNGKIEKVSKNNFRIRFPGYYTSSSVYFHLLPEDSYSIIKKDYKSIDGRLIPITVYSQSHWLFVSVEKFIRDAIKHMKVLEKDFGPWPHDSLLIFGVGPLNGGMEYSGATWTSRKALRHEMDHSYFARSIMPGRGNAGWIDEAIASWGDKNYSKSSRIAPTGVASHSPYRRTTDKESYGPGSKLLGYLDQKFSDKGGLKRFLKDYFQRNKRSVISNEFFKKELEDYFNTDLTNFFNKYIYSKSLKTFKYRKDYVQIETNPNHKKFTHKELMTFL